ncbi:MAG: penicillin acylase family protein [Alphaproteobacteria bacterium]|nr:penicillin acylase family protein [Alphaproteobacteria bacterium]
MKLVGRILIVLLALVAAGTAGGFFYLRQSLPQVAGTLALPGLAAPAEILRDRHGVPHIRAASALDAMHALGVAHAQDRLWQMEVNRRIAAGRLSEAFGASALDTDRFLRTLGIRRVAEATFANLNAETRAALEAYAAGVNAYLAARSGPLPIEFLLTGVRPEPWTPADSIGWVKMMAWDLSGNWTREVLRARLVQRLNVQQVSEFLPPYPGDAPIALPNLASLYRQVTPQLERLAATAPEPLPRGAGSNNWVVAGQRSATGKPLLANDPHLGLSVPSLWYFAHLDAPDFKAIGATLPGVPMVVLGRNARIAWGFTNTGPDTQDLFIEKIDPSDPGRYIAPDGPRPFATREERIRVKGADDVVITVRETRHGPVVSDVSEPARGIAPEGHAIAFAWTALRDDDLTMQAGLALGRAGNWSQFLAAARNFHAPQQNIVYADVDGNIGFVAPGRIPVRHPENDIKGLAPSPGWDARYDWQGFIPFEELPMAFNPPSGRVVTANNKIVPASYPHFITSEWTEPYRARRIEQLLAARDAHSVQSFVDLQGDTRSLMVDDLLPYLLAAPATGARAQEALAMLRAWDRDMRGQRPEPLIVQAWLVALGRAIYGDELGDELYRRTLSQRPILLHNVLNDIGGQSRWCDDVNTADRVETCAERIALALRWALDDLTERYGSDMRAWKWEDAHAAVAEHRPFSRVWPLSEIFELRAPTPGDTYTVNVGRHNIANEREPFANRHAASLRAIYDMADPDRSLYMHSTGQSGNVLSPLYNNFKGRWAKVEFIPMSMRRADAEAGAIGRLELVPAR